MGNRRDFLVQNLIHGAVVARSGLLADCRGPDDSPAPITPAPAPAKPSEFEDGVASGDPLIDRVIHE